MVFAYMATSVVIFTAGLLLKVFPPRDKNSFYSFKTLIALKNEKTWKYCNTVFAYSLITMGAVFCIGMYALSLVIKDTVLLEQVLKFMTVAQVFLLMFIVPVIDRACRKKYSDLYKK